MRISDWSSDVCSSDLFWPSRMEALFAQLLPRAGVGGRWTSGSNIGVRLLKSCVGSALVKRYRAASAPSTCAVTVPYQRSPMKKTKVAVRERVRSEEHTSELQSIMRISYAVFCLKKKNK